MTDELLKRLEEQESENIPLLEEEGEVGLFTDEEIEAARRKRKLKVAFKSAAIIFALMAVLFIGLQGIKFISFAKEPKFEYKINNFSVDETSDDGAIFSLAGSIKAHLPWSFDLRNMKIEVVSQKGQVLSVLNVEHLRINSGRFSELNLTKQKLHIVDAKGLSRLLNQASRSQVLALNLKLSTDARPHWFPFYFHDRTVERSLQIDLKSKLPVAKPVKVDIKDLQLEETANESVIATAKVILMNPLSIGAAKIPKLAFKVYDAESVFLGRAQIIEEFELKPKRQIVIPIRAHLAPAQDDAISKLAANYLAGKPNKLHLRGDSKASTKLIWINTLIDSLDLQITIPGRMFEESIKKIDVKSLNFKLDPEKPESISLLSDAHISYHVPRVASAFRPQIERVAMKGSVRDQQGRFLAHLNVPEHPVKTDPKVRDAFSTALSLEIPVDPQGAENIDDLLSEMLWSDETEIAIEGTSWLKTKMILGSLSLPKIPFSTKISLPGFGGALSRNQPTISNWHVEAVSGERVYLSAQVSLENPNFITSQLGNMHFYVFSDDESADSIGEAWLQDAMIVPGKNGLKARLALTIEAFKQLLPAFFNNQNRELVFKGVQGSPDVHPILKNVMGSMMIRVLVSLASSTSFLQEIHLKREAFHLLPKIFTTVNNPLPMTVKIHEVKDLKVFVINQKGKLALISEMERVPLAEPLQIPPKVENWTDEEHPIALQADGNLWHALEALKMFFSRTDKDYVPLRLEGLVRVSLNDFELEFRFIKDQVPLFLK